MIETTRPLLRARRVAAAALALAAATSAGCTTTRHAAAPQNAALGAVVVDSPDAARWVQLLAASGVQSRAGDVGLATHASLVVVPAPATLSAGERGRLLRWTRAGGTLVTPRPDLFTRLGVRTGTASTATGLRNGAASWAAPTRVQPLLSPHAATIAATSSGAAIELSAVAGSGRLLALGVDPMSDGRLGYELIPGLGREVASLAGAPTAPTRLGVDLYLDPGTLPRDQRDPRAIAERISGARSVKIAAWDLFDDPSSDYDYRSLVNALHARGVLAYAWLEPPFVSLRLWTHHPECRERNRAGKDAIGDWRRLIALEDPSCFVLAAREWRAQLAAADWDGIDVAELYFEAGPGAGETPYAPAALRGFGGDPAGEPARWAAYRTRLATTLNKRVLSQLAGLPGAAQRETVLTVIDDTLDPTLAHRVGNDLSALAKVAQRAGATLEVEDPFSQWSEGPLRYSRIADRVRGLAPAGAWLIDLNVVDRSGARPTTRMTGGELDLAAWAAGAAGRIAMYSAASVGPADLQHASAALGGRATASGNHVRAPWTVSVVAPEAATGHRLLVDGVAWPCSGGRAIVPAGDHTLAWIAAAPAGPGMLRLAAELGTAATSPHTLRFSYFSRSRTYAVIDQQPDAARIDGRLVTLRSSRNPAGGWTLPLPSGRHDVLVSTRGS